MDVTFDISSQLSALPLEQLLHAAEAALFEEAEAIMARSKDEFVPVDEGILRASGHVQLPVRTGGDVSVTLAYGGPAEAYAVIQHERLDFNHPHGGGPKYLERPLVEAVPGMGDRIAARIREKTGA